MCGGVEKHKDYLRLVAVVIYTTVLITCQTVTANLSDECDWTGSGLTTSSSGSISRGVTPIYLRCTAGRVRWLYPRGALRILLRLPGGDREFRACIRVRPDGHTTAGNAGTVPARLFLEGPRALLPLYAASDGGATKLNRCFNSKNGQAAIYVEALPGDNFEKRVADIEYDLQALPRGSKGFDPTEECRPCTSDELAHAFCTSDLVTRGIIRGVENLDDLEVSQMTVKITKLIRHTSAQDDNYYLYDGGASSVTDDSTNLLSENTIYSLSDDTLASESGRQMVTLNVAQHCGVTHGLGEFVFMARRKLGEMTLQCAPRLEDWAVLMNKLTEDGTAHCVLRS